MPRHNRTRFVEFDLRRCAACGKCVEACPSRALGMVTFFSHRHVHVDRAAQCRGCRACAKACAHDAVRRLDAGVGHARPPATSGPAGS